MAWRSPGKTKVEELEGDLSTQLKDARRSYYTRNQTEGGIVDVGVDGRSAARSSSGQAAYVDVVLVMIEGVKRLHRQLKPRMFSE